MYNAQHVLIDQQCGIIQNIGRLMDTMNATLIGTINW
jgi:hypothetical protein